jgi:cathepsin F
MAKLAVVLLLALVAFASASSIFDQYLRKYNKNYEGDEYARRERIFKDNVKELAKQRAAAIKRGEEPWMGVNEFTDMTREEFLNSGRVMKTKIQADAKSCLAHGVTADYSKLDMTATADSFDWRTHSPPVINPIQNQGQCGSCWTFSTIAVIESAYAIKTGKLQKLSEQEIVDCSHGCVLEDGQQVCNQGCNGGWMWSAMSDIISWKGEELESLYPYTAQTGTCKKKPADTIDPISNYTCLSGPKLANETEMAAFLQANGPLSIAMDAGILQSYSSGIINPGPGDCSKTSLDHAIVIVGFGVQGSLPFWIVRNSWGTSWGEEGYFRIIRGKGACGLNAGVIFPII